MLRLITRCFFVGWVSVFVLAEVPSVDVDAARLKAQKEHIRQTLDSVNKMIKNGKVEKILNHARESLNPVKGELALPDFESVNKQVIPVSSAYLKEALGLAENISEQGGDVRTISSPLVLVSFSMPESQIKSLVIEAARIHAKVAIRGLIDNDFKKTLSKIQELVGQQAKWIVIDPTLFERFQVLRVPTFILPLEEITPCTSEGCLVSAHVKATGSSTFRYFFEMISRTGSEIEKTKANQWLLTYEGHQ
jgi:type-F conjugative transfer system pilin assembly protein TrbC